MRVLLFVPARPAVQIAREREGRHMLFANIASTGRRTSHVNTSSHVPQRAAGSKLPTRLTCRGCNKNHAAAAGVGGTVVEFFQLFHVIARDQSRSLLETDAAAAGGEPRVVIRPPPPASSVCVPLVCQNKDGGRATLPIEYHAAAQCIRQELQLGEKKDCS